MRSPQVCLPIMHSNQTSDLFSRMVQAVVAAVKAGRQCMSFMELSRMLVGRGGPAVRPAKST